MTTVTEVRSTSFKLCSTFLQILFLFSSPEGYRLQFSIPLAYFVYTLRHCTGQHCSSIYECTYRLFAGTWRPLVSVITTLYYTVPHVCILFHWIAQRIFNRHHHHPLGYLCAKFCFCSGLCCWASPWRTNHVLNHSLTHPAYLMQREPKLAPPNRQILREFDWICRLCTAYQILCECADSVGISFL